MIPEDMDNFRRIVREVLNDELGPAIAQALSNVVNHDQHLLSRRQAAEALGVSLQTVSTLLREGVIDCVRVRRRVLIPRKSVQNFLDASGSSSSRSEPK